MDSHEDTTVLPLHTVEVDDRAKLNLPYTIIYIFAIMALIYHRLLHLLNSPDLLSFSLFLAMLIAELVFTFVWALTQALKFRPLRRRTFPERLAGKFDDKEFPSIDVFVCTADPLKEPPISVVNTTLSAMAFDYPAEKLSVYVSDDGGSELTLFAFMEAARFAKHWLPFCKEHGIETRCPQAYFSGDCSDCRVKERERMKVCRSHHHQHHHVLDRLFLDEYSAEQIVPYNPKITKKNRKNRLTISKNTEIYVVHRLFGCRESKEK